MVIPYKYNALHLEADLHWLQQLITRRYNLHRQSAHQQLDVEQADVPPPFTEDESVYKNVIRQFRITHAERMVLLLALVPHVKPWFLEDVTTMLNGGAAQPQHTLPKNGATPTIDLALFILAGDDLEKRFYYQQIFDGQSFLCRNGILQIDHDGTQPLPQCPLKLAEEYVSLLTTGKPSKPRFSMSFPARHIETQLGWGDLVLNGTTLEQVEEIRSWIKHSHVLLNDWGLGKRIAPGYKVLFYGPPGTGKTLTASLLGNETGMDVYRIDLSLVVSKYIGETQKNLSRVFDAANNKNWILFFDEADALFGKRSELKDSHDRYSNQEVAYLLQKMEEHNGVVILSTNMRNNIDEAFTRRFQNIIHFPMPTPAERLRIWQQAFSSKCILAKDIDLKQVAQQFDISGGSIMNVIRYASLKSVEAKHNVIQLHDIVKGIRREFSKEGRTI